MNYPVIDLHCDLLGCIETNPGGLNFESPATNCSVPQLLAGGVKLQTLAVASLTREGSTRVTGRQVELYQKLLAEYPNQVAPFSTFQIDSDKLHFIFAIENASGLLEEDAPLEEAFSRFEKYASVEKILYVSLTWNNENRFGGGNASKTGLKRDGEVFLEYLDGKDVAIDFSHTSDALAHDILNTLDKKSLKVTPIASHSNFRPIKEVPRNLPDDIAREIIARGGVIGMNFVRRFIGDDRRDFMRHLQHGFSLGGEDAICLGSDFYGGLVLPAHVMPERDLPVFQEEFGDASCFQNMLSLFLEEFSEEQVEKIANGNALNFLAKK